MATKNALGCLNKYTREQKIVSAVWYHEKRYTGLTLAELHRNFEIRFKINPPKMSTVAKWEQRLFSDGCAPDGRKKVKRRSLGRLIHVPYVRESLRLHPNLTMRARSRLLGLGYRTVNTILKYDLGDYQEIENAKENTTENTPENNSDSDISIKTEVEEHNVKSEVVCSFKSENEEMDY